MIKMRRVKQEDNVSVKKLVSSIMNNEFVDCARAYTTDDLDNTCDHYNGDHEVFYVAEGPEGNIVGTVGIKKDTPRTALLRRLFLKKEYRGKGYGTKLLTHAIDFCKKHGYKKVIFRGTDAMEAAYKTCLKNGFSEKDVLVLPRVKMFVLEMSI